MVRKLLFILLFIVPLEIKCQTADTTDVELIIYFDKAPLYDGDLKDFIQKNIKYPSSAVNDSVEGTVIVSFVIDTLGKTINHTVVRGVRDDLNNEALRVSKLIKFDKPASQKGRPIPIQYVIPIVFDVTDAIISYSNENRQDCISLDSANILCVKRKLRAPDGTPFSTRVNYEEMPDSVLNLLNSIDDIDESPILNSQESAYIKTMLFENNTSKP